MNLPAVEHLHPLLVHFPLALWLLGSIFYMMSFARPLRWLQKPAVIMGVIGTLFGWLAARAGEKAAEIVGPALCNFELLALHERQAETALIFFTVIWALAGLVELARGRVFSTQESPLWWNLILTVGLLMGSSYLVQAGHKGFRLVFEEGAAVRAPLKHCNAGF